MKTLPLRLSPGQDLRRALESAVAHEGGGAAFLLAGIGSLSAASVRFAGASEARTVTGDLEIVSLAGTFSPQGSHLHGSFARASGEVFGGHVGYGCIVRTTAEVLVGFLPEWDFRRELDGETGYPELVVRPRS